MPVSTPVSKSDQALVSSATGALPVSQGPGAIPLYDPNQTWLDGVHTLRSTADDTYNIYADRHNIGELRPTTAPWSWGYGGHLAGGVVDNVHISGWMPGTMPAGYGAFTINYENYFAPGDPTGPNTLENHLTYRSADGTVDYRPWAGSVKQDTGFWNVEHRILNTHFYGRDGTLPLLLLTTNGNDSGRVTIQNDGSGDPLRVVTSGSGSLVFQTGDTGGFVVANVNPASSGTPLRTSPYFGLTGKYWTGTASADASFVAQVVPTSTTAYATRIQVGSPTGYHFLDNAGRVGLNLGATNLLTQNLVIRQGYYAAARADQGATIPLIGLSATNVITIDPNAAGATFAGALTANSTVWSKGTLSVGAAGGLQLSDAGSGNYRIAGVSLLAIDSADLLYRNAAGTVTFARFNLNGSTPQAGFLGATPVARQAAIPDTSGATLANLEIDVNKLKQLIRNFGFMAP